MRSRQPGVDASGEKRRKLARAALRDGLHATQRAWDSCNQAPAADRPSVLAQNLDELHETMLGQIIAEPGKNQIRFPWENAKQHTEALRHELQRPDGVWVTLSLTRIILEAMVRSCYVMDPDITAEKRSLRIAGLLLGDRSENCAAAEKLTAGVRSNIPFPVQTRMQSQLRDIIETLTYAGFTVSYKKNDKGEAIATRPDKISLGVESVSSTFNFTNHVAVPWARSTLSSANGNFSYALASGVIHSRSWMLESQLRDPIGADPKVLPAEYSTSTTMVLHALDSWMATMESFFGVSTEKHRRRLAEIFDEYRWESQPVNFGESAEEVFRRLWDVAGA